MNSRPEPAEILDARGLSTVPSGLERAIFPFRGQVIATDPMAIIDLPHFCNEAGHRLVHQETQGPDHLFLIECRR